MRRSANSHMRSERSVTAQPIGMPSRSLKPAMDFFALRIVGFWPVIVPRSRAAVSTFDLDSTLPMITIHPHWDAPHYFEAKGVPWADKRDAAAAFVSNCRNAGAENRLKYLQKLIDVYPVHSYGRCLHNTDEPPE